MVAHCSVACLNKTGNVRINVTLKRVRVTTVAVEKQCVFTYPEYVTVDLVRMQSA